MPRIQFSNGWKTCKPPEYKFPWGELAVGETRTIYDVSSRSAVSSSLLKWRDKNFFHGHGLGYTVGHCPRFRIEYVAAARITRLPDGPLYGAADSKEAS